MFSQLYKPVSMKWLYHRAGKLYWVCGGSEPVSRSQQHCFTSYRRKQKGRKTSWPHPIRGSMDLWLPHLTHAYWQQPAWRLSMHSMTGGKRSATMISFSHFLAKAPATDEAGHISLHTDAYSRVGIRPRPSSQRCGCLVLLWPLKESCRLP